MRGRRVIVGVDGQDGEPLEVTTGLPPISPALFTTYIADIHRYSRARRMAAGASPMLTA